MDPDTSRVFELLSQRLVLMRQLAEALEQGQQPLIHLDLESIQRANTRQQMLCRELSAVNAPLETVCRQLVSNPYSGDTAAESSAGRMLGELKKRHPDLLAECVAVEKRVRHLNGVYAALLRKTRQSFAAMNNLRCADAITYRNPEQGGT